MEGLSQFREWVEGVDADAIGRAAAAAAAGGSGSAGKRKRKAAEEAADEQAAAAAAAAGASREQLAFQAAHRGVRRAWQMPPNFPSTAVVGAYTTPRVDPNKARFSFGRPDLQRLRQFCSDTFAWAPARTDELLLPVLEAYEAREAQLRLDGFLAFRQRFARFRSKRLAAAVRKVCAGSIGWARHPHAGWRHAARGMRRNDGAVCVLLTRSCCCCAPAGGG